MPVSHRFVLAVLKDVWSSLSSSAILGYRDSEIKRVSFPTMLELDVQEKMSLRR